jgi:hypothetical protein
MSQENLEIVRQLLGPFEQGDIAPLFRDEAISASITAATAPFLTADFQCVFVRDDAGRVAYGGLDGLRAAWLDWLSPWDSYRAEIEEVIDAHEGRVLVLTRDYACPRGTDAEVNSAALRSGGCGMGRSPASSSTGTALRACWRQG